MARRQVQTNVPIKKGRGREFTGLFFLFFSAFLFLSLLSFHPNDPSFNQAVSSGWKIRNSVGVVGAYFAGLLVEVFGLGAMAWPVFFLYLGLSRFLTRLCPVQGALDRPAGPVHRLRGLEHAPLVLRHVTRHLRANGRRLPGLGHQQFGTRLPYLRPGGQRSCCGSS